MDNISQSNGEPVEGTRVFVSHASGDGIDADLLVEWLEEHGHECWVAERDIHPATSYSKAIIEAISVCGLFVLLLTHEAAQSPHVRREIERATSKDRPILVIRLDDVDPSVDDELSYYLSIHQWFDARVGGLEGNSQEILAAVDRVFPRLSGGNPTKSQGRTYVGIDVGSTKIAAASANIVGKRVHASACEFTEDIHKPATARSLVGQIKEAIRWVISDELGGANPAGIGVALPGQVDPKGGSLKFGPGLGLRNTPIRAGLAAAFPRVSVRIDNDTRCAARCELHLGAGLDYASIACIFIGTGVGSGLTVDRRIHIGANYCAGEIGHMKIDKSGPPCNCGQVGCLETFVNGPAVASRAQAKVIEYSNRDHPTMLANIAGPISPRDVADAADEGDEAALEVMGEIGTRLGIGIANYLNIMNPDAVVLGGGVISGMYLHLVGPISEAIERNALPQVRNTPILQSQFTDTGPAIGASLLFHPAENWTF